VEGTHLMEGTRLARIARLDQVSIEAEVYQDDASLVKVGAALTALAPGSSRPVQGVVDRVEPWLDAESRRAKVRATVPNPDQTLLPNMGIQVILLADLGEQVAVPADAVITTGTRRIVFVDAGRDRLVPRDVQVGRRAGSFLEVRGGLQPGEAVVTSGAFLVASESRIRASETYWGREPEPALAAPRAPGAAAVEAPVALRTPGLLVLGARHQPPEDWAKQLVAVIDAYLATKDALVRGDLKAAAAAAGRVKAAVAAMPEGGLEGEPSRAWAAQAKVLIRAAEELERGAGLEQQRDSFFALSEAAYAAAWSFEHARRPLFVQRCPMAHPDQGGARWLSAEPEIRNPYFGDAMLGCGEISRTLR
jgi:membrane fusion protein, copper/silver efflux system